MKLKEAKEIVRYILDWQFVLMGVKEREDITENIDLSKYSLSDIITANSMVQSNNRRKEKISLYHSGKGHKTKGYSISMVLADRSIAAVYTGLSFPPNSEAVGLIDDVAVGCVKARYE
jgi:hypothetical protein